MHVGENYASPIKCGGVAFCSLWVNFNLTGFIFRTVEDVGFEFITMVIMKHSIFQDMEEHNTQLFHKVLCRHVPVTNSCRKISILFFLENICLSYYAHVYPSPYLL
jgi:hypothetical protein